MPAEPLVIRKWETPEDILADVDAVIFGTLHHLYLTTPRPPPVLFQPSIIG
jgi:hypothetical protein